jgi:hypothetical protein
MVDRRKHRGQDPEDAKLFAAAQIPKLQKASGDFCLLLTKGYPPAGTLKLVGDHFSLTARQRLAVMRTGCSDGQLEQRKQKQIQPSELSGRAIAIDGYNLLITIETALSGGFLFKCADGCFRDLAGLHGTYRQVEETVGAIELTAEVLQGLGVEDVLWLFDRPVSNSGKLKTLIYELAERNNWQWNAELHFNPDKELIETERIVVSSDSDVLDKCNGWVNLTEAIIAKLADRDIRLRIIDLAGG